ncbi:oxygen-independent coproporphyrinogen III oxidase [Alkaliphilus pronyensis]|uniref:Heme chaperone HemW n=1 Tax=Alkaliphilus pronyensis TaxID=1482732 RepID=A0A6I0FK09_9FIRM|nr:radical SAM family heme chaperone HemW [Alkaliphilus pronyensis]KAB3539089.1 oxygen-independent coproporphyrinogen III oxidase [Alkaliphilus pronyensis]
MLDIGLYIHIPFCERKCFYCDFNSFEGEKAKILPYLKALLKEIELYSHRLRECRIKTIFIGGGTPSLLMGEDIYNILNTIIKKYRVANNIEITIETNPGTLRIDKLNDYKTAGINRLSVGLQACQDHHLKRLGRIHSYKEFMDNIKSVKKIGFNNINVDLMFSLPNQTLNEWRTSLRQMVELEIPHISAYSLILEEGTALYKDYKSKKLVPLKEEQELEMFHYTIDYLKQKNYNHYEISNFGKEGFECKHNLIYWNNEFYLGLGAGAHSYMSEGRFNNVVNIDDYIRLLNNGEAPVNEITKLTTKDEISETMFLGLRMMAGVSIPKFKKRFGICPFTIYKDKLVQLEKQNLITITKDTIKLTPKGIDLANLVFAEMLIN